MKVEIPSYFTQQNFQTKINEVGIKNITELDVSCRSIIIDIPYFPNLKKLNCYCSNIYSIPLMEKLEELYCWNCLKLPEIPNFPNLIVLHCTNNLKIKFYKKNLVINCCKGTFQHFQGRLFQNTYRTYELLIF